MQLAFLIALAVLAFSLLLMGGLGVASALRKPRPGWRQVDGMVVGTTYSPGFEHLFGEQFPIVRYRSLQGDIDRPAQPALNAQVKLGKPIQLLVADDPGVPPMIRPGLTRTTLIGLVGGAGAAVLAALAGILAAGAGAWLKYTLVTRAAFNQGFALAKLPVRGARP